MNRQDDLPVNDYTKAPHIVGNLEVSTSEEGVLISGDPPALRSLAALLVWLADIDQESLDGYPDGWRSHVHLHTRDAEGFNSLTDFSEETTLSRLDGKGTGDFPKKYQTRSKM